MSFQSHNKILFATDRSPCLYFLLTPKLPKRWRFKVDEVHPVFLSRLTTELAWLLAVSVNCLTVVTETAVLLYNVIDARYSVFSSLFPQPVY